MWSLYSLKCILCPVSHRLMWELDHKENNNWRIDALKLGKCWRKIPERPQTARRTIQSILKDINLEDTVVIDAEAPILWLPRRGEPTHLEWILMLGKVGSQRKWCYRGWNMIALLLQRIGYLRKPRETVEHRGLVCWTEWGCQESDMI